MKGKQTQVMQNTVLLVFLLVTKEAHRFLSYSSFFTATPPSSTADRAALRSYFCGSSPLRGVKTGVRGEPVLDKEHAGTPLKSMKLKGASNES